MQQQSKKSSVIDDRLKQLEVGSAPTAPTATPKDALVGFSNDLERRINALEQNAVASHPFSEQQPAQSSESTTTVEVECPDGVGAGDTLSIEVGGRSRDVLVPEGVRPGETFSVNLSAQQRADGLEARLQALEAAPPADELDRRIAALESQAGDAESVSDADQVQNMEAQMLSLQTAVEAIAAETRAAGQLARRYDSSPSPKRSSAPKGANKGAKKASKKSNVLTPRGDAATSTMAPAVNGAAEVKQRKLDQLQKVRTPLGCSRFVDGRCVCWRRPRRWLRSVWAVWTSPSRSCALS